MVWQVQLYVPGCGLFVAIVGLFTCLGPPAAAPRGRRAFIDNRRLPLLRFPRSELQQPSLSPSQILGMYSFSATLDQWPGQRPNHPPPGWPLPTLNLPRPSLASSYVPLLVSVPGDDVGVCSPTALRKAGESVPGPGGSPSSACFVSSLVSALDAGGFSEHILCASQCPGGGPPSASCLQPVHFRGGCNSGRCRLSSFLAQT